MSSLRSSAWAKSTATFSGGTTKNSKPPPAPSERAPFSPPSLKIKPPILARSKGKESNQRKKIDNFDQYSLDDLNMMQSDLVDRYRDECACINQLEARRQEIVLEMETSKKRGKELQNEYKQLKDLAESLGIVK